VAGSGWVLRRDSERIRLAEVYREVVFDPAAVGADERDRAYFGERDRLFRRS
jgi:DNA-binding IscR family transcriptional regulator